MTVPQPPWNIEVSSTVDGRTETTEIPYSPSDPISRLFLSRPHLVSIELIFDDMMSGMVTVCTKVIPETPRYGMSSDEGNMAVDLAVQTVGRLKSYVDIDDAVRAVINAVAEFGKQHRVDLDEINRAQPRDFIRAKLETIRGDDRLDFWGDDDLEDQEDIR